jgi:hypothetical protein
MFDMCLKVNGSTDHFIFVPTLAHKLHELRHEAGQSSTKVLMIFHGYI